MKNRFWPKEHGAYGQLGLPLVAALAMGRPTLASFLLVAGAVLAFLAHEPLLVRLGLRGRRALRDHGEAALRAGLVRASLALALGAGGLWLAPETLFASLPVLGLALVVAALVFRGLEKTTGGEVVAASALSGASLPVAVAGGVSLSLAFAAWGAWVVAFAASTAAVRWVIARHKTGRGGRLGLGVAAFSTLAVALLALHSWVALSALPMLVLGWALMARPPHPVLSR